jgi:hypothetical protein
MFRSKNRNSKNKKEKKLNNKINIQKKKIFLQAHKPPLLITNIHLKEEEVKI